jgi:uncharacterized membrane protein
MPQATIIALMLLIISLGAGPAAARAQPAPTRSPQSPPLQASDVPDEFYRGRVIEIESEQEQGLGGVSQLTQVVRLRVTTGPESGSEITALYALPTEHRGQRLHTGDRVVLIRTFDAGGRSYEIVDRDRVAPLIVIALLFAGAAIAFSRVRGLTSLVGLAVSLLVLAKMVAPRILAGGNPLAASLLGACVIAVASIYLAHGFSRRTSVALVGTIITLAIAAGLAIAFVGLTGLQGTGSEEAVFLQAGYLERVNLRGLLLGGIILGALGVLDDVTTAQAAAVEEISRANAALSPRELYRRGLSVGQEHITALVNTLVLAYAGASLPLFLLFTLNTDQPLWVTINSEFVAEEIVRTLVGSLALILAVPITTLLAARLLATPGGGPARR